VIDYAASPAIACVARLCSGAFGAGAFTHLIMVFLMCVVKPKNTNLLSRCYVLLTLTAKRLISVSNGLWAGGAARLCRTYRVVVAISNGELVYGVDCAV